MDDGTSSRLSSDAAAPTAAERAIGTLLLEIVGGQSRFRGPSGSMLNAMVNGERALVGRHEDADVAVVDDTRRVSRRHALIERAGTGWWIRDWHSGHGTSVAMPDGNAQPLVPDVPQPLGDGLLVDLAGVLTFRVSTISGISGGDSTVQATRGSAVARTMILLDPLSRTLADALTAPFRGNPPRQDAASIDAVMAAVNYGRTQTYELLRELAEHPALGPLLTTGPGDRGRHRELAGMLVRLFPELGLPRRPLSQAG